MLKILVAFFSQTGNTEKVARAIFEEVSSKEHNAQLKKVNEITPDILDEYDLVFLGTATHDADLAQPVKNLLQGISPSPGFKLAGFATHSAPTPEGGGKDEEYYQTWASKCPASFNEVSQEKQIDFLGYFSCMGAPSPPIGEFIHNTIITDEDEWEEYMKEVGERPDEEDLQKAREFAWQVLGKC